MHEPRPTNRERELATADREGDANLPNPGFTIDPKTTALVVTNPQNDFLNPTGVAWDVVGKSVTQNRTVENRTFSGRRRRWISRVFISPHYYFPLDHRWQFEGRSKS